MTTAGPPSERARVRRLPQRAAYDRATVDAILDEALVVHVGVVRAGAPVVVPVVHGRAGDTLLLHGSTGAGFVSDVGDGAPVCVTATIVDGIVLGRSARNHSLNYRSVVVHGRATPVRDADAKLAALVAIFDRVHPARWEVLRPMTEAELRETAVLAVSLDEASAKVRTGPPLDPDADRAWPVWAGVVPVHLARGEPVPD